jgi:ABC-type branched-subunit amino acid transport system ATPase component
MDLLLDIIGLEKSFGGLAAVGGVSFSLAPGRIKSVIGPNGAGKTTLFNLLSGVLAPDRGRIVFGGREIAGLPPHAIAGLGMSRTFQITQVFKEMTAAENVMTGGHLRGRTGFISAACRFPRVRREEREASARALDLLREVGLDGKAASTGGSLPLGQQRLLEIARALASSPRLILLDEPGSGLSRRERQELIKLIFRIRDSGVTVLLVEHDMNLVMDISDEVAVLDYGRKIAEGPPRQIRNDPAVIAAYLGEEAGEEGPCSG